MSLLHLLSLNLVLKLQLTLLLFEVKTNLRCRLTLLVLAVGFRRCRGLPPALRGYRLVHPYNNLIGLGEDHGDPFPAAFLIVFIPQLGYLYCF